MRRLEHPRAPNNPFPFSRHLQPKRGRRLVLPPGTRVRCQGCADAEARLCLLEAWPGLSLVAPAYNGNPEADHELVLSAISNGTLRALRSVAGRGDDDLGPDTIASVARAAGGHVRAVLAWYGFLASPSGRLVGFDFPARVRLEVESADFVAVALYWQRHTLGARVGFYIRDEGGGR